MAELNSCTLSRNKITGMEQVALIEAHGPSTTGVGQGLSQDTAIILRQLKIIGSTAPHNLLIYSHDQNDFGAAIYSDEPLDVHVLSGEAGNRTTLPLEDLPSDTKRINASSAWFRSTQQVRHSYFSSHPFVGFFPPETALKLRVTALKIYIENFYSQCQDALRQELSCLLMFLETCWSGF